MTIYEVVKKLVGEVNPIGSTEEDKKRFTNLMVLCNLVENLEGDIRRVALGKDKYEYSVKIAGEYADDFLKGNNA